MFKQFSNLTVWIGKIAKNSRAGRAGFRTVGRSAIKNPVFAKYTFFDDPWASDVLVITMRIPGTVRRSVACFGSNRGSGRSAAFGPSVLIIGSHLSISPVALAVTFGNRPLTHPFP